MTRTPALMFAIAAFGVLALGIWSQILSSHTLFHFRAYVLPVSSLCFFVATLLCSCAVVYGLWMLRMNATAALWHFALTCIGLTVFGISFYEITDMLTKGNFSSQQTMSALAWGQVISVAIVSIAQGIFVVNFILAMIRLRSSAH
jgi:hypothetical protein